MKKAFRVKFREAEYSSIFTVIDVIAQDAGAAITKAQKQKITKTADVYPAEVEVLSTQLIE